jgi:hypothetical protein
MIFEVQYFSWGVGLVLAGWAAGMSVGYVFKILRHII